MKNDNIKVLVITLILIIGNLIFKSWGIWDLSMYEDEPFTLFLSQFSVSEIIEVHKNDSNPFLHTLIMHYWLKIFGYYAWAGKLYSVILSSITAGLIFKLFTKRFGWVFALTSALLFSLSGNNLFHAQEMRVYPQLLLITVLSIYFFIELLYNPNRKNAIGLLVSNLLLMMSHYTAFFLPLAEMGILIFYIKTHKKSIKYFIVSQLLAVVLFAPWFLLATINNLPTAGKSWIQIPYLVHIPWFIERLVTWPIAYINIGLTILVSAVFILKKANPKSDYRVYLFLTAIFWGTLFGSFIISKKIPIMSDRYLVFATIGMFLSIGYGLFALNLKKYYKYAGPILVILVAVLSINFRTIPENWPTKMEWVKKKRTNNELIIAYPWWSYRVFSYYYNYEYFKDFLHTPHRIGLDNILLNGDLNYIKSSIEKKNPKKCFLVKYKGVENAELVKIVESLGYTAEVYDDQLWPFVAIFSKTKTSDENK